MKNVNSKKPQTVICMLLIVVLVVTTMTDMDVPYLPVLVMVVLCIMAFMHSRKTAVKEIVLDGEKVELLLTDGSTVMLHQREIAQLKFSGSRIVIVLRNRDDYNIPKKNAKAIIRRGDEPLREIAEDDFPFAEMKKALG